MSRHKYLQLKCLLDGVLIKEIVRKIIILVVVMSAAILLPEWLLDSNAARSSYEEQQVAHGGLRQMSNDAFTVGEKLTFDISWGVITGGQATMSIPDYRYVNGRKTFETRVEAASSSSFDWIFKVRDRYETFMDVDGMFPWRFEQHVREGSYSKDYNAFFDPETKTYTERRRAEGKTPREIRRCLKRHVARRVYKILENAA